MTPPEAWGRAWGDNRVGMAPFLRAFQAHMRRQRPHWPRTPDLGEFLAAADPRLWGDPARQRSLEYPLLKSFNEIRKGGKQSTSYVPPDARRDRYWPVLPDADAALRYAEAAVLPYAPPEPPAPPPCGVPVNLTWVDRGRDRGFVFEGKGLGRKNGGGGLTQNARKRVDRDRLRA